MVEIHGTVADGFEPVRATFAANFEQGLEQGASVAVTLDGVPVADLWAGDAGPAGTAARPWERDTLVNVWSTTKTMGAIAVLMAHDRGLLDIDAPVADVWPEFAVNGKAGVLVRHVLAHSAGLPGWSPAIAPTDLADRRRVAAILAAQAPVWEPGARAGYHAITQGFLEGEIVQRATGRSLGEFFRDEVAGPLGADFHIGLPEDADHRIATLIAPDVGLGAAADLDPIARDAFLSCPLTGAEPNERWWRAAEIPAAGGSGNARSIGRVHSVLACGGELDGVHLLSEATLDRVLEEQTHGTDAVLGIPMRYGIGFGLMSDTVPLSPNPRAFFWGGWGGSIAIIDRDARLTVSYAMNRMAGNLVGDARGGLLVLAAYQAVRDLG